MPFPPLHPLLQKALADRDYHDPTPVQSAVIDGVAANRDLVVSAQTGSGKTVAYGLALAGNLLSQDGPLGPAAEPLVLVVAPTRELAQQVTLELAWLYAEARARVVACVGGMDIRRERRLLADGAHIVVGTPGRLRDHIDKGHFDTSRLKAVVLDEADEMLDLGFREDLEFILDETPAERRTLLFSATMPKPIALLAKRYQKDALRIDVSSGAESHADIEYRAVRLAPNELELGVVNVLRFFDAPAALVFCHTRESVRHLHASLVERGFAAVALSGELSQGERNHALQALRDGRARVCVATDVAARGIDLPGLDLVIHAELPTDRESLLHRSGRTGRAGRKGISIVLVPYNRRRKAEFLLASARVEVAWVPVPTADEIRTLDQERLLADPILAEELSEEDLVLGRALLAERSAEAVAAALVRFYRARLPAPEDLIDAGDIRDRGQRDRYDPRDRDRGPPRGRDFGDDRQDPRPPRDHADFAEGAWFRMNVGRQQNADPRWLLPLICRIGHVTKRDVGAIRISDTETHFAISANAAAKFVSAVRRAGDEEVVIEPMRQGPGGSDAPRSRPHPRPDRPPRKPYQRHADAGPDVPAEVPAGEPAVENRSRPAYVRKEFPEGAVRDRPPKSAKRHRDETAAPPATDAGKERSVEGSQPRFAEAGQPPRRERPFKAKGERKTEHRPPAPPVDRGPPSQPRKKKRPKGE
ncbi:MAG: DEAD/DEAH box helicase [Ancalomicrobiaceae bacterium]|nr:DEAD/DEAH box helicase [Ancalomicrobiaceae bacterium]